MLGKINPDLDGDVIPQTGKVLEVETHLVNVFHLVNSMLAKDVVAFKLKLDARAGCRKAASLIQLVHELVAVEAVGGAKVEIVGEPSQREIAFAQSIAAL